MSLCLSGARRSMSHSHNCEPIPIVKTFVSYHSRFQFVSIVLGIDKAEEAKCLRETFSLVYSDGVKTH